MKHFTTEPGLQEILKVQFHYSSKENIEDLSAKIYLQIHPANKTQKWLNLETTQ